MRTDSALRDESSSGGEQQTETATDTPVSSRPLLELADALPTPTPTAPATPTPTSTPRPTDAPEPNLPEPEPTDAPTPERAIIDIICSYPWGCETAIRVFSCESELQPDAISYNGSSYGVAQIWKGHAWRFPGFWERWMIPEVNIGWAYELWGEQGWEPWEESRSCWWMP